MTWIETATREEIVAEMARKPDPEILLEWIHAHDASGEFGNVIAAYWAGLEYEHS